MLGYDVILFDIEADGLYDAWAEGGRATKIHCVCAIDHDNTIYVHVAEDHTKEVRDYLARFTIVNQGYKIKLSTLDRVEKTFEQYSAVGAHNSIGYDFPMMKEFLGLDYSVKPAEFNNKPTTLIDTLIMSRMLWPDRPMPKGCPTSVWNPVTEENQVIGAHGLQSWGYRVGGTKPEVHDWRDQPISTYVHRCIEDVINNLKVFDALIVELADWYNVSQNPANWKQAWKKGILPLTIEHQFAHCFFIQEQTGILLDQDKARENLALFDKEIKDIEDRVNPTLPTTPIGKTELKLDYTLPKKIIKNGTWEPTKYGNKFLIKHNAKIYYRDSQLYVEAYGQEFKVGEENTIIKTEKPLTIDNSAGIKNYLLDLGWEPTMFNTTKQEVKGRNGKTMTKNVPTTPKVKEAGVICPNLLAMDNEFAKQYIRYNTLKHRRNFIQSLNNNQTGILNHPRLDIDGRLPAGGNTIGTPTLRCTHRTVVNIPSGKSLYGTEMRSMFVAPEGFYQVGWDGSALEKRMEAHESYPFDEGAYARELLEGDTHSITAAAMSKVCGREVSRDEAKGDAYAILYGCSANKLAKMLNVDLEVAKQVLEAFWEANWATKAALDYRASEWKRLNKKFISSIAGGPIHIRSEHSLFNARLQSSGSIVMKLAHCITYDKIKHLLDSGDVQLAAHMHDESQVYVKKGMVSWTVVDTEEEVSKAMLHKPYGKPVKKDGRIYLPYCEVGVEGVQGIVKAGEVLKLNIPLAGEYMVGLNWGQCH